jgi:hypothetical protein
MLAGSLKGQLEMETFDTLEMANHLEEIPGLWVPLGPEHAHEAFCRPRRETTQFLKPDRGVDVIPQYRFSSVEISGEQAFDSFSKQLLAVLAVSLDAGLYGFLELSCEGHGHFSFAFRFL